MEQKQINKDFLTKINRIKKTIKPIKLGSLEFTSKLLMAPMAGITSAPFRLLMQDLGAGGTVTELISAHAINYKNEKTLKMLTSHPKELNLGIQIFGEEQTSLVKATIEAQKYNPKFIDLNLGCPVKKVVSKGGGAALTEDLNKLENILKDIKKNISIPLTIKIRTGKDQENKNAEEVVKLATQCGVEFVAIHGRTRAQQYKGRADWDYLESIAKNSKIPIIGNGDLHHRSVLKSRLDTTNCDALMLGRGPIRNPFLFLQPFSIEEFVATDYIEVIKLFNIYLNEYFDREKLILTQLKKHVVWFAFGFYGAAKFRGSIFTLKTTSEVLDFTYNYFLNLGDSTKSLSSDSDFLSSGHG